MLLPEHQAGPEIDNPGSLSWRSRGPRSGRSDARPRGRWRGPRATIWSASDAGTRGSLAPVTTISGMASSRDPGHRRDREQPRALGGIALVAIFDPPQVAAIGLGVLEEGDEVGDGDDAIGAAQAVAVADRRGVAHIAAIGAAGHARCGCGRSPGRARSRSRKAPMSWTLFSRSAAPLSSAEEALAVAGRAADVRVEDRDALLVQQIIVAAEEAGPRLRLRARRGC